MNTTKELEKMTLEEYIAQLPPKLQQAIFDPNIHVKIAQIVFDLGGSTEDADLARLEYVLTLTGGGAPENLAAHMAEAGIKPPLAHKIADAVNKKILPPFEKDLSLFYPPEPKTSMPAGPHYAPPAPKTPPLAQTHNQRYSTQIKELLTTPPSTLPSKYPRENAEEKTHSPLPQPPSPPPPSSPAEQTNEKTEAQTVLEKKLEEFKKKQKEKSQSGEKHFPQDIV